MENITHPVQEIKHCILISKNIKQNTLKATFVLVLLFIPIIILIINTIKYKLDMYTYVPFYNLSLDGFLRILCM